MSSASAESVMNHLISRRLTKHQQMRRAMKDAHYLLQAHVELLDGRLETCFARRFPRLDSLSSPDTEHPSPIVIRSCGTRGLVLVLVTTLHGLYGNQTSGVPQLRVATPMAASARLALGLPARRSSLQP